MSLFSRYRDTPDDRWLELLIRASWPKGRLDFLRRLFRDPALPSFPDETTQRKFVGSSGELALREGYAFYQVIKRRSRALGRPITPDARILDFGCGWGRIIRFFLKDVPAGNLHGVDVDERILGVCRETIREVRFDRVAPQPPTALPDASLDVVYAYSVFSHLAEETHLRWVREFGRILRPGGLVFATTQKRSFMEWCNTLTAETAESAWQRGLARSFRPLDEALARYDAGELVYEVTGSSAARDSSFYGEAAVPERFVDRHWPPHLSKVAFEQDGLPQALIIARRDEDAPRLEAAGHPG